MTQTISLDRGWTFRRLRADGTAEAWSEVDLPHTPFVADLDGHDHWCGECEYSRTVELPGAAAGARHVLVVGAAMHTARVLVDGREVARHEGGYLPFEVELPVTPGAGHCTVALRLDNRDAPDVPPGKPLEDLDFCWYGGLYRSVELRVRPPIHITDPVGAGEVGGGGVFVRTLSLGPEGATIAVQTHVRNSGGEAVRIVVAVEVLDGDTTVARVESPLELAGRAAAHVTEEIALVRPRLWSPDAPNLHRARVTVRHAEGFVLDQRIERFGVRRIAFSRAGGFVINGRRLRLRGTNRHQEYPRVGYAAPRAAQYRDVRLIKEAGFDYVRLSHYPQSPHFLDACDELGIVVMNAIPGWQFVGGAKFQDLCVRDARVLIRRDRNHPCVVLWELSLNETAMDDALMARLHSAGHEEYPGDQMFTCGWIDRYDVFVHARQHGRIHTWGNGDKALVVSEYGDWEFYATNEGFDQKTGAGVLARWSNSRHFRGEGERALRQQAWNHTLALNDTLCSPAALDGQWAVFDYARGYDPVRAAVGVADVFRLPKFSYWFYRSQRDPHEGAVAWSGGPVVFVASYWTAASDLRVVVFSNCEEVQLRINGHSLGRRRPDLTWHTQHLPHPPFVFDLSHFAPGVLEATGFMHGVVVTTHLVRTPETPSVLEIAVDDLGILPRADEPDVLVAHARLVDRHGTLCVGEDRDVTFEIEGEGSIVGPTAVAAEAGVASIVVRVPAGGRGFVIHATAAAVLPASQSWGRVELMAASAALA
ncbi:MAG: DUF4982 domain-containing protein [Opitutaceae bacterium]|nr:DUF4982 domain-containing protein [Opitutaceae bacterium]